MKIEIDTEKLTPLELDIVIAMLQQLKEGGTSDDALPPTDESKLIDLSEAEVLHVVSTMHNCALALDDGAIFKTPELYRKAMSEKWIELSPNTRKALGRRFKKLTDEHYEAAEEGDTVVVFKGRNIQNSAIYEVETK